MTTRRKVLCLLSPVSAGAWFLAAQMALSFSIAPNAVAAKDHSAPPGVLHAPQTSQTPETLLVSPDSPRWDLQGQAELAEYLGRRCLRLDGGVAVLRDFEMRDGVIDVDVATPANRGFFGIQFRIAGDDASTNAEWVYLRQHKSGQPDAMQYTPVLKTGLNWQIYNGPGFTGAVDIPRDVWFHLRLEVSGAQARLYVKDM